MHAFFFFKYFYLVAVFCACGQAILHCPCMHKPIFINCARVHDMCICAYVHVWQAILRYASMNVHMVMCCKEPRASAHVHE